MSEKCKPFIIYIYIYQLILYQLILIVIQFVFSKQMEMKLDNTFAPWIMKKVVCHYHTEELNFKGSNDVNGIVRSQFLPSSSSDDVVFCPNFVVPGGNRYFIGAMFLSDVKTTEELLW